MKSSICFASSGASSAMSRNDSMWRSGMTSRCVGRPRRDVADGDDTGRGRDVIALTVERAEEAVGQAATTPSSDTSRPRTRTSSPTCAVDEPRRVVVAVAASWPVDEHDVVGAELRAASARAPASRESAAAAPIGPSSPAGCTVSTSAVRVSGPRRVGKDVRLRDPGLGDDPQRVAERRARPRRESRR